MKKMLQGSIIRQAIVNEAGWDGFNNKLFCFVKKAFNAGSVLDMDAANKKFRWRKQLAVPDDGVNEIRTRSSRKVVELDSRVKSSSIILT